MKMGRKIVGGLMGLVILSTLTISAFAGTITGASNYGIAKVSTATYSSSASISQCSKMNHSPIQNYLAVEITYTFKSGSQYYVRTTPQKAGTSTSGQSASVSCADPITEATGYFEAACKTCGRTPSNPLTFGLK